MTIISFTLSGVVAPVQSFFGGIYGMDNAGLFGPAGASIAGQDFTVTWTGIDCNCFGRDVSFNPVIDAVLTINDHSYDFGAGVKDFNDFANNFQQVETVPGSITLATGIAGDGVRLGFPGHDGSFHIQTCCVGSTQAFLTFPVPGPIMGAEVPGLLAALIIFGGFYWKRLNRHQPPRHFAHALDA